MAFTKFSIAPDNRLVYRSNGNVVRGTVNYGFSRNDIKSRGYTVIDNRVYHNGRLAGYVGKGSVKQEKQIKARAVNRLKRAEKRAFKEAITEQIPNTSNTWVDFAYAKDMMDNYRTGTNYFNIGGEAMIISRAEQGLLNYASVLKQATDLGIISDDEADEMWFEYQNSNEAHRSEMWNTIHQSFDEQGYEVDSPPLFGEMGRMLGLDDEIISRLSQKL